MTAAGEEAVRRVADAAVRREDVDARLALRLRDGEMRLDSRVNHAVGAILTGWQLPPWARQWPDRATNSIRGSSGARPGLSNVSRSCGPRRQPLQMAVRASRNRQRVSVCSDIRGRHETQHGTIFLLQYFSRITSLRLATFRQWDVKTRPEVNAHAPAP